MTNQGINSESVLLVGNDPTVFKILEMGFKESDYGVIRIATARDALKLLKEQQIPYIVIDSHLPDMQGIKLAEKVKELVPLSNIVILTDYCDLEDTIIALDGPVDDYLLKPFRFDQMKSILKKFQRLKTFQTAISQLKKRILELEEENGSLKAKLQEIIPGSKIYINKQTTNSARQILAISSYSQHIKKDDNPIEKQS